jgi:arylsulfatase A-like enzyme
MVTMRLIFILSVGFLVLSCGESVDDRPNVVLILIDTMRADHLGCYGYSRDTSPCIDSLAENGTRYARVQAQSPWTLPAMTTIMTGLSHRSHRAGMWNDVFYGIDPSLPYMPVILNDEGYRTAAFFNVLFMSSDFGFHRGFDLFDCESSVEEITARNARVTVDETIEWIQENQCDGSFFLAVHFYDPHLTYDPEPPYNTLFTDHSYHGSFDQTWGSKDDMFSVNSGQVALDSADLANLVNLYDGEVAFTDHEIGRLLQCIRSENLSEHTLVIVAADHGEEFLDHSGVGHGHTLYQELLNVPLVVSGPGIRAGYVENALVGQIDILPSILDFCGIVPPQGLEGRAVFESAGDVSMLYPSSLVLSSGGRVAVRRDDAKLHWIQSSNTSFQFDLLLDPGEMTQLQECDSTLVDAAIQYWSVPPEGSPAPVSLEDVQLKAMRNLGYI